MKKGKEIPPASIRIPVNSIGICVSTNHVHLFFCLNFCLQHLLIYQTVQLLLKQLDSKWQGSTKPNTTGVWSGYLECCFPPHLHSGIIAHFFLQSNHKNVKWFILRRSFQERAKESQKKCLSDLLVGSEHSPCWWPGEASLFSGCKLPWVGEGIKSLSRKRMEQKFRICLAVQEVEAFGQAYGMCFRLGGRQKKKKKITMFRAVQTK